MPVLTGVRIAEGPLSRVPGAQVLAVPQGGDPGFDTGADLAALLEFHEAKGEAGEVVSVPVRVEGEFRELLLYGTGGGTPADLRKTGAALAGRAKGKDVLAVIPPEGDLAAFTEAVLLAGYEYSLKTGDGKKPVREVVLVGAEPSARGEVYARAAALARDLTNTPASEKGPAWLADRAVSAAAESGLSVRVWDEGELREQGFGGILAVGSGSPRPPRLIQLSYAPEGATRHIVLVGKGITFDTGGISIKPPSAMTTMKTDMAGGAVVIGVLSALRDLGVGVRVTGLVAAAENMPSGSAMRPSDVITHYGGTTSEVLNTDAEGRLVLADALAYADSELAPDAVVDIATLTGAAKVALGLRYGALFATDDALARELEAAAKGADEPLWRMPLTDDYRQAIVSDVADVANIEKRGFGGGSIMAALFLEKFAGSRPWAHLDVAGPARAGSAATAYGVRLLLDWLTES
ncbi:leucyl aminopeptidase family protein [Actinocorallia sp. API 0066]|uniref:leucyl aminopeptidase family protein n=1 Tax=Actinocorallia sp. API 0066 TaxID=2896846 RepID=UPI001E2F42A2|nr:leucyl aminopeptidase family protein [Actinocorallia sp. API 0066]MCD0448041.1 leucyl aminopeptidase family protein [Actinocorallia sp. API 0066]